MRTWYLFVDDVDGLYIYVYMYIDRYTNECGRTLFVVSLSRYRSTGTLATLGRTLGVILNFVTRIPGPVTS